MTQMIRNFLKDEQAQDLIEYTLLLAFICLAAAALFLGGGNTIQTAAQAAKQAARPK